MRDDTDPTMATSTAGCAALVIHLDGDLDLAATAPIGADLLRAADLPAPELVVLDLTAVRFCAAAAVHAIDAFAAACAERGIRTHVVAENASVARRIIQVAGLDRRIPVFATVEQALPALS
jgi:anti-anti-sigma factor